MGPDYGGLHCKPCQKNHSGYKKKKGLEESKIGNGTTRQDLAVANFEYDSSLIQCHGDGEIEEVEAFWRYV